MAGSYFAQRKARYEARRNSRTLVFWHSLWVVQRPEKGFANTQRTSAPHHCKRTMSSLFKQYTDDTLLDRIRLDFNRAGDWLSAPTQDVCRSTRNHDGGCAGICWCHNDCTMSAYPSYDSITYCHQGALGNLQSFEQSHVWFRSKGSVDIKLTFSALARLSFYTREVKLFGKHLWFRFSIESYWCSL